ncbi:hypothetical protein AGMMS50267_08610 [Spirochaetia bacterium]|nr:hypothetical protein AGMMS50267_08580 [Spirochaetia bacterium]GHV88501.1 hypothetical protein AGMMS50267_08610 [Spirochaetia bacterium]
MKQGKVIIALLILFTVGVNVHAQVTFGAWGRAVITPLALMGDHSAVSAATSTWGDVPNIGFSANGTAPSGNIGFNIDFDFGVNIANNNAPSIIGDNAKAWVKPLGGVLPAQFNMLKLTAGWFKEQELRGRIGASEFASWLVPNGSPNEDNIFQRFDATAGAHFKLEPLLWLKPEQPDVKDFSGLSIQGAFGSSNLGAPGNNLRAILNLLNNEDNGVLGEYDPDNPDSPGDRKVSAADVYKAMQIAVGYRIPDVGLVRAQFIGNNRKVSRWTNQSGKGVDAETDLVTGIRNTESDVIEWAFLFDGVEGLKLDLGMKIPLEYTTRNDILLYDHIVKSDGSGVYNVVRNDNHKEYTVQDPYVVALGASWTPQLLDSLNITARVDASFGGAKNSEDDGKKITDGLKLDVWFMPSFRIIPNFTVGVDVALDIHDVNKLEITGQTVPKEQMELSAYTDFGVGPWIDLGVGGGHAKIGVVVMFPSSPRYAYVASSDTNKYPPRFTGDPVISVPISFTYSF